MPIKVLVVEGINKDAHVLKSCIAALGYQLVGYEKNGDRAIDMIYSLKPDIILLDLVIRGATGALELAKIIRSKFDIPFIYMISTVDDEMLANVGSTMPYGYLFHPINQWHLRGNVEIALARFKAERNKRTLCVESLEKKVDFSLSQRDKQVLAAFLDGLTYKEIAARHFISVNTVKTYQKRIFSYFEVRTRYELVNLCREIMVV